MAGTSSSHSAYVRGVQSASNVPGATLQRARSTPFHIMVRIMMRSQFSSSKRMVLQHISARMGPSAFARRNLRLQSSSSRKSTETCVLALPRIMHVPYGPNLRK